MGIKEEALTIMMEECAEVIVEASKIIRFGNDFSKLEKELGDLEAMLQILQRMDFVSYNNIEQQVGKKFEKLKRYSNLTDIIEELE